eukprot:m.202592 g.202592  ORF g.202592 m.202592 type:complete len:72 (+) comp14977_c1_seq14:2402-2617(+)
MCSPATRANTQQQPQHTFRQTPNTMRTARFATSTLHTCIARSHSDADVCKLYGAIMLTLTHVLDNIKYTQF